MPRPLALVLTVLTGFSGLVYEVAWQGYLATLLGSHSEATAVLLGIFLAGLSIGYWLFGWLTRRLLARSRRTGRAPRLLVLYGLVEAGIGVFAILFPTLFGAVRSVSHLMPHAAPGVAFAFDVALVTILVGPPTVLMGATIPVLTQALARGLADATRLHSLVYALNTAGAFVGALAAGFVLIPTLGLERAMDAVGAINLLAGALFVSLGLRSRPAAAERGPSEAEAPARGIALYSTVALLNGFAMMAVQTVVIRLGGLAFGASQFTFSMVVAVFVLAIALGSLGVSALSRIRPSLLILNQGALATLLLLLYLRADEAPYWAHVLRMQFPDTDAAFYPFHLAALVGMLAAIGLPVALSGAALPLLFHHLRRTETELGAVAGTLYSWNTVGSLLGALLGGYALLFWTDLAAVYRIAVGSIIAAGGLLAAGLYQGRRRWAWGAGVAALLVLRLLPPWDPHLLSSGLFRLRSADRVTYASPQAAVDRRLEAWRLLFYDDDPTASVAVLERDLKGGGVDRVILNNGKSDGSTYDDRITMGLAGVLPVVLADSVERAFVVGLGTGVTAGELASIDSIGEVVVAEISPGVIRAAPLFDLANGGLSQHAKIRLVRRDAYRALLRATGSFDAIVSEPSNPWMTGIEMLYSREFLQAARDRLSPGGVYVQWYHLYETDSASVELVLRTYASVFDRVAVWYARDLDLLLLGFRDGETALDLDRVRERATRPDVAESLERSGITSFPALLTHELLPIGTLNAARLEGKVHTLYHPRLSYRAGRAFYRGRQGRRPFLGYGDPARASARGSLMRAYLARFGDDPPDDVRSRIVDEACRHRIQHCGAFLADWMRRRPDSPELQRALRSWLNRPDRMAVQLDEAGLQWLTFFLPGSSRDFPAGLPVADVKQLTSAYQAYYNHAIPFDPRALLYVWSRCESPDDRPGACEAGAVETARQLGLEPAQGSTRR